MKKQLGHILQNPISFPEIAKPQVKIVYRDTVHIRKDIISALVSLPELNQSKLVSYCNLNNVKHRWILLDLTQRGLITRVREQRGGKFVFKYKVSESGKKFLKEVLQPYEEAFPRADRCVLDNNVHKKPLTEQGGGW